MINIAVLITCHNRKKKTIKVVIEYNGPLQAPIAKGDIIGSLNMYISGELVRKVNVISGEEIKRRQAKCPECIEIRKCIEERRL